jgi:hypothetical protein
LQLCQGVPLILLYLQPPKVVSMAETPRARARVVRREVEETILDRR